MLKKIFIFLLLFLCFSKGVFAKDASVIIINQIRGDENCCEAGSLELIESLKNDNNLKTLSYGWALRFDALENDSYTTPLNNFGELGLLLEVTPQLASASGVYYKGKSDGSDWYFAKNAFLVGYTVSDRKKIIDTLFGKFKEKFGYYPSFTVAWMIDAWSLDYISNNYRVKLHELTKEQYETDSYTLYGGIFNAPYYPSKQHPLISGYGEEKLDLVVVRQTISDILRNYGSPKARYTSQPNDYLENKENLNIEYFKKLIEQTINQKSGFKSGVLGFENSYSWEKFGEEYIRQLRYISKFQNEKKLAIKRPSEFAKEFSQDYRENQPLFLTNRFSDNEENEVFWYFGENYRARLIKKKGKIILDDLRNYSKVVDPYREIPCQNDYAYWIIPYLIDGSQQYSLSSDQKINLKKIGLSGGSTLPDTLISSFGIVLGEGNISILEDGSKVIVEINGGKKGKVTFLPKEVLIEENLDPAFTEPYPEKINDFYNSYKKKIFHFDKQFDLQIEQKNNELRLGYLVDEVYIPLFYLIKDNNLLRLLPVSNIEYLDLLSPMFQPDRSYLPVDQNKSTYYWNNRKAITGRNPVRLFILPKNKLGRPTKIEKLELKFSNNDFPDVSYPDDYSYRVTPWFIDISAKKALKSYVSIFVDKTEVIKDVEIEFITDCQTDLKICLINPKELVQYILVLFNEQKIKLIQLMNKM